MNPYVNGAVTAAALQPGPSPVVRDDDDFLATAEQRFTLCVDSEAEVRRLMVEDLEFYDGQQWDPAVESGRKRDSRPCLTINRLPQFVHQISNNIRQQKPSPKVSPVDETGDVKTADVFKGLIRHIERQSKADIVRSYAAFYAITAGRGFYRITTRFIADTSWDQEIYITRIKNPHTVYFDPGCQEPDYSDARYCFIVSDITDDEFAARYPDADMASAENFRSVGDGDPVWRFLGGVRIAEYFCRHIEQKTVALLADGTSMYLEDVPPGMPVERQRTVEQVGIRWCVISSGQILEERSWPGKYIPVIPVMGEEYDLDGKTRLVGMVRHAKDPQRMLNYWESCKTETIALAPRAPFIGAEGQFEKHEEEWAQANSRNWAYLQYKPKSVDGTLVPAPQRQVYEPPIQAITLAQSQTVDHLKSATGVYDASLGNRSNETTGVAIQARQVQGDTSNYHYIDNLSLAITHEARILVDLIPKIYDRPGRVARIIGEDNSERQVTLNQEFPEGGGQMGIYDLKAGRYDVVADIGPSFATRKQESTQGMLGFAQVAPELVPRYADLLVQGQDWPMADEIADRVRPPDVPPKGGAPQIPPQVQQKLRAYEEQNQMLQVALNETTSLLNSKQLELQSKERLQTQSLESKERIAAQGNQVKLTTEGAKLGSQEDIALMHAQVAAIQARLNMLSQQVPIEATQRPPEPPAMPAGAISPTMQQRQQEPPPDSFGMP